MDNVKLQNRTFLILLIAVSLGFIFLLQPFLSAIFWAATLAVIFWPIHQRILRKMPKKHNLAAIIMLTICLLIAIIPVLGLTASLIQEFLSFYDKISQDHTSLKSYYQQIVDSLPQVFWTTLEKFGLSNNLSDLEPKLLSTANQGMKSLSSSALSFGQNTLQFAISFTVMLYLLFFLFRDGATLVTKIRRTIPMDQQHITQLTNKFNAVVRATVKGNIVVAMVQGALGGIMFWAMGIQGAILWGVVMAILSLLPAVGAGLIWAPVAIYLLATGSILKGVLMIVIGVAVIGVVDNVLRPILVGKETKMPDYLVLISTLGGIALFGITGFVLGPVIAALFIVIWEIFTDMRLEAHRQETIAQNNSNTTAL